MVKTEHAQKQFSREPIMTDEPYIRSTDGARMIPIAPGEYVNEAVWKKLAKVH